MKYSSEKSMKYHSNTYTTSSGNSLLYGGIII